MALISIKDLTIEFSGVKAVDGISLDIPHGETMGLVGESGSGKSVTALALLRLIGAPGKITTGSIELDGPNGKQNLLELSQSAMRDVRGNRISMIFQEPMTSLNPVFTIGNQIIETIRLHQGLDAKKARARAIELLESVKIPDATRRIDTYPHELSGGQKQRAMIAMAMACEPDLLIADEPTTALDVTVQKQVIDLMLELQAKHKMSLLFITHDLTLIGDIADRVAVMSKGKIVESGTVRQVFQNPTDPYTKGLLSCRPKPGQSKIPKRLPTVIDFTEKKLTLSAIEMVEKVERAPSPVLLDARDISKYFPITSGLFQRVKGYVKAVDGVSIRVERGKTLGLVGESGCGKTTLGRTLLRLLEPTSGTVYYEGKEFSKLEPEALRKMRRKMQIIFQDPYSSLNPRMTVLEMLTEPMAVHEIGAGDQERENRAEALLKKVGLIPEHLARYPHEFSGGQRQRICIARALSVEPEFIVCDESVSALDVSVQAQVLNLLLDLQDEFGLTYVFISHDLSVVHFIADRIAVMSHGKIIEEAPAQELYRAPKNAYTRALLAAIPTGTRKLSN